MIFEAWAAEDPLGSKLGDLTHAFEKKVQVVHNGIGSLSFRIRQDSVQAAWCTPGTHIRVRWGPGTPYLPGSVFLEAGQDAIISDDEHGGEVWQRGGRSALASYIEARAVMYPTNDVATPAVIGSDGKWVYTDISYGAILNDVIAQAKARDPDPLAALTDGISATVDGNGDPWVDFDGDFEIPAGMNIYAVISSLQSQGLIVVLDETLTIRGYGTYGDDLTASIVFEKGVNIRESGERQVYAKPTKSRVLVQRADGTYQEVTDALTATYETAGHPIGRREGFTMYRHSSSPAVITRAGQQFLRKTRSQREGPTTIGVLSNQWVPFEDYKPGDKVAVTIPGVWDGYGATIAAITINEDDAGANEVTLDFEQVPFDAFTDMQASVNDMIHGPGCKPGCGHDGGDAVPSESLIAWCNPGSGVPVVGTPWDWTGGVQPSTAGLGTCVGPVGVVWGNAIESPDPSGGSSQAINHDGGCMDFPVTAGDRIKVRVTGAVLGYPSPAAVQFVMRYYDAVCGAIGSPVAEATVLGAWSNFDFAWHGAWATGEVVFDVPAGAVRGSVQIMTGPVGLTGWLQRAEITIDNNTGDCYQENEGE